jgi:hypothetical protein
MERLVEEGRTPATGSPMKSQGTCWGPLRRIASVDQYAMAFLLALLTISFVAPASAKDCTLRQIASLDLSRSGDDLAVPVKIAGTDRMMLVNLAVPDTGIVRRVADELHLPIEPISRYYLSAMFTGDRVEGFVTLPEIQLGSSVGRNAHVLAFAGTQVRPDIAGVLGTGVLSNFDTELDLRNAKLNLFSKDHCEGAVVYWANTFASLPYSLGDLKQTYFDAALDGESAHMSLITRGTGSFMMLSTAKRLFGLEPGSPGMTVLLRDAAGAPAAYRYPFKQLVLGGVAVNNPAIDILPDSGSGCLPRAIVQGRVMECRGGVDLYLGLNVVQQLHLYFSTGERTLYVTAADAHK